jgi:hypothetical protein
MNTMKNMREKIGMSKEDRFPLTKEADALKMAIDILMFVYMQRMMNT